MTQSFTQKKSGLKQVFPLKLRPKQATVTSVSVKLNFVICGCRGAFSPPPPHKVSTLLGEVVNKVKGDAHFCSSGEVSSSHLKETSKNFVSKQPPTQILMLVVWSYDIKKDAKCTGTK
jgi:hypothetical protein